METLSYSKARQNLAKVMKAVCDEREPVVVKRRKAESVVMMPYDEFRGWMETLNLLRHPTGAARLRRSIAQINAGKGLARALIDP
ncbi:MAG: type II toxin-antitoxin system prevent-host-death family antitoxin [Alphaproteobacteria bacterium]|nr:type II toxin-antitoxin system prevent-host-death family antitoxin [Alphaproteobacteria bacterium]